MTEIKISVRLSQAETDYLCNADFLDAQQIEALQDAARSAPPGATLHLTRGDALAFTYKFTTRLAEVGFDKNYDPTPEGRMLEDFIDRFFVP